MEDHCSHLQSGIECSRKGFWRMLQIMFRIWFMLGVIAKKLEGKNHMRRGKNKGDKDLKYFQTLLQSFADDIKSCNPFSFFPCFFLHPNGGFLDSGKIR